MNAENREPLYLKYASTDFVSDFGLKDKIFGNINVTNNEGNYVSFRYDLFFYGKSETIEGDVLLNSEGRSRAFRKLNPNQSEGKMVIKGELEAKVNFLRFWDGTHWLTVSLGQNSLTESSGFLISPFSKDGRFDNKDYQQFTIFNDQRKDEWRWVSQDQLHYFPLVEGQKFFPIEDFECCLEEIGPVFKSTSVQLSSGITTVLTSPKDMDQREYFEFLIADNKDWLKFFQRFPGFSLSRIAPREDPSLDAQS